MGDLPLSQVAPEVVEEFALARVKSGLTKHNTYREVQKLQEAMRKAYRLGWWRGDILSLKPEWLDRGYIPKKDHWSEEEAAAVVAALPSPKAARVAFVLATSASWGPTNRVQPEDFNWGDNMIWVRGSKTRHRQRWVPIFPWTKCYAQLAAEHAPFVRWDNSNSHRDLKLVCAKIGVKFINWNGIRGSVGLWLRQRGVSSDAVAGVLGHANDKLVQEVYSQLKAHDLAKAIRTQVDREAR